MSNDNILVLNGNEVLSLLNDRESEIIHHVRMAYIIHSDGDSSLPHSTFVRFPNDQRNRIIALPAYLGNEFNVAGVKWISSFPGNLDRGEDRASAVVILNSLVNGRPKAIVEGSIISAKRTAASASLAAQCLKNKEETNVGFLGCGLINFEIARFLLASCPEIKSFTLFDVDLNRANAFRQKCKQVFKKIKVKVVEKASELLTSSSLISMATTAASPHLAEFSECVPGAVILHISLRDISPNVILDCDNIVDDIDHVCRAQTSLHLAEQFAGNRDFIRCTLADILRDRAPGRRDPERLTVFSPFGLGVLDLAVAELVYNLARQSGQGKIIDSFFPTPWSVMS
jgi:2,3-diaminopropionate biosynthesis protein SbnB